MNTLIAATALGLAAAMGTSGGAPENLIEFLMTNGAGACQAALPIYEQGMRKRPTAIANEGTADVFVSCSVAQDWSEPDAPAQYGISLNNNTQSTASVTCTFVRGARLNGVMEPDYWPQTVDIPARGSKEINWKRSQMTTVHYGGSSNWSCALPPGIEIGSAYYWRWLNPPVAAERSRYDSLR